MLDCICGLEKRIKFPLYLLKCANHHDRLANDSLNERILKIQLNCKRWVYNKSSKVRGKFVAPKSSHLSHVMEW